MQRSIERDNAGLIWWLFKEVEIIEDNTDRLVTPSAGPGSDRFVMSQKDASRQVFDSRRKRGGRTPINRVGELD